MAEPRVFLRQKWSRYLGELRPIHDIYVGNEIFPSPTPSVTPPVTPTSTPLVTPTNTPSVTQTSTQTNTPNITSTPTNSPTSSPAAPCLEQLFLSATSILNIYTGTYDRMYSYTGGSFSSGYYQLTPLPPFFSTGPTPNDSQSSVVWTRQSGSDYFNIIRTANSGTSFSWTVYRTTGDYFVNGGSLVSSSNLAAGSEIVSSLYVPQRGVNPNDQFYFSYPLVCPTTTPTNTPTLTPTNTPSSTIGTTPPVTSTNTSTPTITPTNTQTPYPVCPEQIVISQFTGISDEYNGTYNRVYSYTGGTFTTGYSSGTSLNNSIFFTGAMSQSGLSYAVYERQSGSTYYTLIMRDTSWMPAPNSRSWGITKTIGASFVNGALRDNSRSITNPGNNDGILVSGVYYPPNAFAGSQAYKSYPEICPTTTPTPSNTATPSVTPTLTQTPTSTNPCPSCNQFYFSAGTRTGGNSPTGWTGTYELLKNVYYTQFNDQSSSPPSFSGECSSYEGISYTLWKNENDYGIGLFKTSNTGSTLNQYYYSGFTLLYPEVMSRINYGQCGITFSYSGASGFAANLLTGNTCNGFVYPKDGVNTSSIYVGQFLNKQDLEYSITYLNPCITPTPTRTLTPTATPQVSPTSTPTMTNTQTSTPTNTPSITPSTSPPSCSVNMTVDNNTTGGGVDITGIEINGTPVTYVSGDNFSVLPGELGTFSTSITGVSVTMVVFYDASNANHAINVTDCDVNSFCCDNLTNGVGSCTFEGLAIDCTCTNGIQIIANNGDCL